LRGPDLLGGLGAHRGELVLGLHAQLVELVGVLGAEPLEFGGVLGSGLLQLGTGSGQGGVEGVQLADRLIPGGDGLGGCLAGCCGVGGGLVAGDLGGLDALVGLQPDPFNLSVRRAQLGRDALGVTGGAHRLNRGKQGLGHLFSGGPELLQ
jgi:hypothetical protein